MAGALIWDPDRRGRSGSDVADGLANAAARHGSADRRSASDDALDDAGQRPELVERQPVRL